MRAQISPFSAVRPIQPDFHGPARRPPSQARSSLRDFGPNYLFRNPRPMRQPVSELVAGGGVRNPGGNFEHPAEELPAFFVPLEILPGRGLIEQGIEVRLRRAEFLRACCPAFAPDERIGVDTRRQHRDVHPKAFSHEQFRAPHRSALARGVGIETEDDFRRETFQQSSLGGRQGGSRRRRRRWGCRLAAPEPRRRIPRPPPHASPW